MIRAAANSKSGVLRKVKRVWRDDDASQIVEFALSLPLLVVFVVGIFDFSSAITLKQKLTNAAREGARVAASDPANDLGGSVSSVPVSVADALWVVDNYLTSEKIADCQLTTGGKPLQTGSTLTWVSTGTGSPCTSTSGLILTVNRGWITQETVAGTTVNVVATQVTIQYPYAWQFSGVFGLTGKRFVGPTSITTSATALNEN
jgi:Flp pilus assembly protein TadG